MKNKNTLGLTGKILDIMRMVNAPICVKDVFMRLNVNGDVKYKSVSDLMIRLSVEGHLDTLGKATFVIKPRGKMSGNLLDVINRLKDAHLRLGNIPIYFDDKLELKECTDTVNKFLVVKVG